MFVSLLISSRPLPARLQSFWSNWILRTNPTSSSNPGPNDLKKSFQINTSRFHDSNFIQLKRERWDLTKSSGIQQNTLPISLQQNMKKIMIVPGCQIRYLYDTIFSLLHPRCPWFWCPAKRCGFLSFPNQNHSRNERHEVRRNPCSWEKQTPRHNKHLQMDLCKQIHQHSTAKLQQRLLTKKPSSTSLCLTWPRPKQGKFSTPHRDFQKISSNFKTVIVSCSVTTQIST